MPILLLIILAGLLAKRAMAPKLSEAEIPEGPAKPLRKMLLTWRKRGQDKYGSGDFGASRDEGKRRHEGVDYVAWPGDILFAPFDGEYERAAKPYSEDERYTGLVLFSYPHRVTVFYVFARIKPGEKFKKGDGIGTVQDLTVKYAGISNHIHVEVEDRLKFGKQNPEEYF